MFGRVRLRAAVLALTMAPAVAFADPQLKANDIVKSLTKSMDLGASRGICIGSLDKCEGPRPKGLNMMVNFELDSTRLTPQGTENLDEFAKALTDEHLASARFIVEGYTDALGTTEHNQVLSEDRARAVTAFLVDKGVPADRISAVGFGERDPIDPRRVSPINRRVEMRAVMK